MSKNIDHDDIETLVDFNVRAEKLLSSSYTKAILKGTYSLREKDGNIIISIPDPSEESLEAFILRLRFFIQDNEPTSFNRMSQLYSRLPVSQTTKDMFDS
jgi:hypothetical protein